MGRGFAGATEPAAGRPVTILAPRGGTEERRLAKLRYAAAAFAFLHQQLLVAPAVRVEDRGARRRLEREGCPPERQVVRVVRLRRPVRSASPGAEPSDVAWSCRWIVRGHWRRQWWPSLGRHQPRWIAPHVKGPEDKPLSPPRATVFAVVR
ncbi:MAG TPA: hypothetical protein VH257_16015 [Chloroflexota bacterium]|nr:hypothetical protein [Chloroflexota bacterium]